MTGIEYVTLNRTDELPSCLGVYSFLGIAYDLAQSLCLLMVEQEPSTDHLFHQTVWLPNSGREHRLRLLKMEREAGKQERKKEREMVEEGPFLCCSAPYPQWQGP